MNLKTDILNEIGNQEYFTKKELIRLNDDNNMNYKQKIFEIDSILERLVIIDLKYQLASKIFIDNEIVNNNEVTNESNQSHAE